MAPPKQATAKKSSVLKRGTKDPAMEGLNVVDQIRYALKKNAARVIDLFREWDENGDGNVSKQEFRRAMPMLGLDVPDDEVDKLFDEFNQDGGNDIGLGEMQKLLRRGPLTPTEAPSGSLSKPRRG